MTSYEFENSIFETIGISSRDRLKEMLSEYLSHFRTSNPLDKYNRVIKTADILIGGRHVASKR